MIIHRDWFINKFANANYCSKCDSEAYCPGVGPVAPNSTDQGMELCSALTDNSQEGAYVMGNFTNNPYYRGKEVADSPETCSAVLLYGTREGISLFFGETDPMQNYNINLPANTNNSLLYQRCLYNTTTHAYTDCIPLVEASEGFVADSDKNEK